MGRVARMGQMLKKYHFWLENLEVHENLVDLRIGGRSALK
jgi:hypothetical protein